MIEPRIERLATSKPPDRDAPRPAGVSVVVDIGGALKHLKGGRPAAPYRTAKSERDRSSLNLFA
jgi:hypothetical protein